MTAPVAQSNYWGCLKIGHARNVIKRLRAFSTGMPGGVRLVAFYKTQRGELAREAEKRFHTEAFEWAIADGEWFRPAEAMTELVKKWRKEWNA